MGAAYVLSPAAQNDIDSAVEDLAEHWNDANAAEAYVDRLYDELDRLADNPGIGHRGEDLTALPVFFWNVLDRYAVIYRRRQPVEIVRVLPWKMDISGLLRRNTGFTVR